jgi:hypothetical protein
VELPEGTVLQVRQTDALGTRTSRAGDPVTAVLIAPVLDEGRVVLPAGCTLRGRIQASRKLGFGFRHHTASIDVVFDSLRFPDGDNAAVDARVIAVEGAKERVDHEGRIHGIRPTWNVSSTLAAYAWRLVLLEPAAGIPVWATKMLFAPAPDPEIHFPVGTELNLRLVRPLSVSVRHGYDPPIDPLDGNLATEATRYLSEFPQHRVTDKDGRNSDLLNLMFLGSSEQIHRAFRAAGWSLTDPRKPLAILKSYFSVVARRGYPTAPMVPLRLQGELPGIALQKSFNTIGKRHHLRIWSQPARIGDSQVWLSSATEDTGIGFSFKASKFTHTVDENIDLERTKVINDLAYTGCIDSLALVERFSGSPDASPYESLRTDGKVAVVVLNDCLRPRVFPSALPRTGKARRIAHTLSAWRDDLVRSNFVSLFYGTAQLVATPGTWFKAGRNAPLTGSGEPHSVADSVGID